MRMTKTSSKFTNQSTSKAPRTPDSGASNCRIVNFQPAVPNSTSSSKSSTTTKMVIRTTGESANLTWEYLNVAQPHSPSLTKVVKLSEVQSSRFLISRKLRDRHLECTYDQDGRFRCNVPSILQPQMVRFRTPVRFIICLPQELG